MSGDKYAANQAGAMGPGAQANNSTFLQSASTGFSDIQLSELVPELGKLRAEMRACASDVNHDIAIAEVAKAEDAGKNGDTKGLIEHLKSAGGWAAEIATKVGVSVASKAIQEAIGLK